MGGLTKKQLKDKAFYESHREAKKRASRKYYWSVARHHPRVFDPELVKIKNLKRRYGISLEQYSALFRRQRGCCAICKRHQREFKRALAVDHDHKTKRVRGLLCINCNRALGLLRDDVKVISNARKYLQGVVKWQ